MMAVHARSKTPAYSSKIIKAGALLADSRTLFAEWDEELKPQENLDRVRSLNLFAKASRSRINDVLSIFRQRYLGDLEVPDALSVLVKGGFPSVSLDRIFYFHSAQSDPLLHDVVTEVLVPMQGRGGGYVSADAIVQVIKEWSREERISRRWSEVTSLRVAQELLATLRDFGVLSGARRKQLTLPYLPTEAFAYIAFVLNRQTGSGERLINSGEWDLFFLQAPAVERLFIEAQQTHFLQFHAAGRIMRVDFPAESLQDYARALTNRSD